MGDIGANLDPQHFEPPLKAFLLERVEKVWRSIPASLLRQCRLGEYNKAFPVA